MKKCVESAPITPMQKEWFENILSMIPAELKKQKGFNDYCKALFAEIETNFEKSMKKSMGKYTAVHSWVLQYRPILVDTLRLSDVCLPCTQLFRSF